MKGFTEALITDLRAQRAAHQVLGGDARPHRHLDRRQLAQGAWPARDPTTLSAVEVAQARARMRRPGVDGAAVATTTSRPWMPSGRGASTSDAPTTAAEAAKIILDGGQGRSAGASWSATTPIGWTNWSAPTPSSAYDADFFEVLAKEVGWRLGGGARQAEPSD